MGQKKRRRFKSRDGKCDVWELEDGTFEGTIAAKRNKTAIGRSTRRNLAGNLTRKSMGFWESGPNGYTPL